jgi:geranylgeranyl pyrophosphate synthase
MRDLQAASPERSDQCGPSTAATEHWSHDHLTTIIDRRLRVLVPGSQIPPQWLHQAMGYSLLAPGKRLRPLLTMLTSFHFGLRDLAALDGACAIEMVHAASLIIDDLPSMDNSALRRGQPTAHRQFGEDMAILSGIALLNLAYGVVGSMRDVSEDNRIRVVRVLADAVGSNGLIGGQVFDLRERTAQMNQPRLESLNQLKTAALFVASAEIGALIANAPSSSVEKVRGFATELGLALQIADDLLDDHAYAGRTGKDTGSDEGKPTLPSVLGQDAAKALMERHLLAAHEHLEAIGGANGQLARYTEAAFSKLRS